MFLTCLINRIETNQDAKQQDFLVLLNLLARILFLGVVRPDFYFLQNEMALEETLLVSDVLHFNVKYLTFECRPDTELEDFKAVVDETTRKTMNAFEVLMAKGRDYPKEKGRRYRIKYWFIISKYLNALNQFTILNVIVVVVVFCTLTNK